MIPNHSLLIISTKDAFTRCNFQCDENTDDDDDDDDDDGSDDDDTAKKHLLN